MLTIERSDMSGRKMVQIGIRLPEDVVRQLKVTAAAKDMKLQEYVCMAVEDHLARDASDVEASVKLRKKKSRSRSK